LTGELGEALPELAIGGGTEGLARSGSSPGFQPAGGRTIAAGIVAGRSSSSAVAAARDSSRAFGRGLARQLTDCSRDLFSSHGYSLNVWGSALKCAHYAGNGKAKCLLFETYGLILSVSGANKSERSER
jgi:hypothetical protein